MKKKKITKEKNMVAVGVGVVALAAATYFLFGPNGKKNRKHTRGWMIKMKGEVIEKLEEMEDVTEPVYHKVVDTIAKAYSGRQGSDKDQLKDFTNELKKNWKDFSRKSKSKK